MITVTALNTRHALVIIIGDYPINEDDARSERILLASAHDGIIADEDNRLLLNHLTHGTTDVIEFKLDYPISWNDDE